MPVLAVIASRAPVLDTDRLGAAGVTQSCRPDEARAKMMMMMMMMTQGSRTVEAERRLVLQVGRAKATTTHLAR